jgi:hypothetical protein
MFLRQEINKRQYILLILIPGAHPDKGGRKEVAICVFFIDVQALTGY